MNVLRSFAASLLLAASARAGVLVVAADGSAPYLNVQHALSFAVDGDVVLVRSGTYASFEIDGRSMTVAADTGANVVITGRTVVRNLLASQTVVLSGLRGTGATSSALNDDEIGVGLLLANNAGAVRVQACRYEGATGYGNGLSGVGDCCWLPNHTGGWDGIRVVASTGGTVVTRSVVVGGRGRLANLACYDCGSNAPGGDGIHAASSPIAVYETTATGGVGESNGHRGGDGGNGVRLSTGAGAFLSGVAITGGAGGSGNDFLSSVGGHGGDGLVVDASSIAQLLACTLAGGAGGVAFDGITPPSPPGQPLDAQGGVFTFTVDEITLETAPVLRAGTALHLDVRGTPGALVYADLGDAPTFEPRPSWRGVVLVASRVPRESRILGTIPASGLLTVDVPLPPLAPGVLERALHVQVARTEGAGGHVLGEPAVVTRLAAGI